MRRNSNLEKFEETIFLAKEKFFSNDELGKVYLLYSNLFLSFLSPEPLVNACHLSIHQDMFSEKD